MATVAHSTLTGADLHEPKGVASAASNTVYVANGAGSGNWSSAASILSVTGMIADFALPVAPSGWLECDGSQQSRATFAALFAAVTIQQTGNRVSGTPTITGLSSTANMRAGYFIGGTGITNGTTILSVDSGTQVTMSANATSSGSNTVIVSPWSLGDGSTTFNLPDSRSRYRRARDSTIRVGLGQADAVGTHNHTAGFSLNADSTTVTVNSDNASHQHTGTTNDQSNSHTHDTFVSLSGTTSGQSNSHHHTYQQTNSDNRAVSATGANTTANSGTFTADTSDQTADHTHTWGSSGTFGSGGTSGGHSHSFTTNFANATHSHTTNSHTHTVSGSITVNNSTTQETRPISIVVITCIKT